jgi:PTH1 family peptidyl-tRNA hydrolase
VGDEIAKKHGLVWQKKFKGEYALLKTGGTAAYLHKPLTFMNNSGRSVQQILAYFKIETDCLLVVHDEVEMDPGSFGLKFGGGLAGHKGLRSIAAEIGSREFFRLRIGVGHPMAGRPSAGRPSAGHPSAGRGEVASHVLARLTGGELDAFGPVLDGVGDLIYQLLESDESPSTLVERYAKLSVT